MEIDAQQQPPQLALEGEETQQQQPTQSTDAEQAQQQQQSVVPSEEERQQQFALQIAKQAMELALLSGW